MVDYYFDTVMDVAPEGDYVMPTDTVSLRERWTLICMRATALRQQVLEVGRKAQASQASQMAGLTTTPEITALSYSTSRTKILVHDIQRGEAGRVRQASC